MNKKKFLIIPICVALCASYLTFEDVVLQTTRYEITSSKLPDSFNGFKIAQISDFHNTGIKFLRTQVIDKLHAEAPNIIVLTGDIIDSNTPNINIALDFVTEIKKIAPVYFVVGNHEASSRSRYDLFKIGLENAGVVVLENDVDVIIKDGKCINIIGINDPGVYRAKEINGSDLFKFGMSGLVYDKTLFTVVLCHRPELFETYADYDFDVVFTGHAHGGQVRVPFVGGLYAPHQGSFPKYTAGVFKSDNTNMIISRGIGNSTFPFRVNNRPELVIATLRKE